MPCPVPLALIIALPSSSHITSSDEDVPPSIVTAPPIPTVPLISTLPFISIRVELSSISSSALMSKSPSASDLILIALSLN